MIRWDLLQPVDIGGNFQAGFQTGKEIVRRHKLQGALVAYSQDPTDPEAENALAALSPEFAMRLAGNRAHSAAESAERQRVGSYFVNPDRKAAKQQALESGDIDIAKQIDALGEDERKAAAGKYKAATPVAYQALKLKDPAQRQAYIQSVKPELVANGWSEQDIDGFDPSDANLNAILTTGMTLEQAMGRDKITYKEVGPGARLVPFDDTGRPVNGTGQPAPIDNPVSETAPPEAAPGSFDLGAAADLAKKFGTVTSTVRSPEHNRKVGGVANSYHLKGQAIDIARAPGVSHAQIEQAYRAAGYPIVESLDEGDHSHIAFGTAPAKGGADKDSIRRHAMEAIAAGADAAAVKARAAGMGVTL